jgi:hypothetical protein
VTLLRIHLRIPGFNEYTPSGHPANPGLTLETPVKVGSPEHKSMGLLNDSVINLETLTSLKPREIEKKIGACGSLLNFDPPLRVLLGL